MWICTNRSPHPRLLAGAFLLSFVLLLAVPATVTATSTDAASEPDCAQSGLEPQSVTVQLTRKAEGLVQGRLHAPSGVLPTVGCRIPIEFHIPEPARPLQAVWRDVEARAVQPDGTPDPTHPDPLPLRLWIHPDGNLQYEVREAGLQAAHAALDLAVAWGTTAAANDLAVLDILRAALGLNLDIFKPVPNPELVPQPWYLLGARMDDRGRVTELDWHERHPDGYWEGHGIPVFMAPAHQFFKEGIRTPGVRTAWRLPSELGQLSQLRELRLGGPLLTGTIPPELGQLTELELLTLAGSRITALPPELGQLTKLGKLDLHHNLLTTLPPELAQLTRLGDLNLAGNRLTALPPELAQLTRLSVLSLAGNRLTALPPELGKLKSLEKLGLAGNQLTTWPSALGQLPNLEALDVQDNQLTSLPPLAELNQLWYLDLSGNRLTALPEGLPRSLLRLDMSDNRLQELNVAESLLLPFTLPPQAGPILQNLHKIARERGALEPLPLESLDLSGNQLSSLPPEIGRLRLYSLDLSGNQLSSLPPEFGRLRLEHLDLSDNRLTSFPLRNHSAPDCKTFHYSPRLGAGSVGQPTERFTPRAGTTPTVDLIGSVGQSTDIPAPRNERTLADALAGSVRQPTGNRAACNRGNVPFGGPGLE